MWFDGTRQPNTLYVASVSRGKDSTAMLRAIQLMNWPLDEICSVDIWFDDETPAELPPMVAFKDEWDAKCLAWFGVPVTRLCATKREKQNKTENAIQENCAKAISTEKKERLQSTGSCIDAERCVYQDSKSNRKKKLTYCDVFYRTSQTNMRTRKNGFCGFPTRRVNWCNSSLKVSP